MGEAATLLEQTLAEEKKTDELLIRLARGGANPQAEQAGSADKEGGESTKAEAAGRPSAKAKANKAKRASAK